ncbi:MAG: response regulator [Acidobacteria bacterium OLB17]|nr:MAG: response regulator [Acidobacteria bacterium OLB17]MCZ2390919.1 response regulator transcription factor [Acidobacteriota bacterium]
MHQHILVVEDDADIAESLEYNLRRAGFRPIVAESGEKGLHLALDKRARPKLIILDLMLPGMSGTELCRRIRREPAAADTPIIMLTARSSEADRIAGLDIGADDYIVKPFSVKELIARVNAVLRRSEKEEGRIYRDKRLLVDREAVRVECEGKPVKLTRKEFSLLEHLIDNIGRVAPRQQLLDSVWGYSYFGDSRTLDVHIRRLRQKLGSCGGSVETVIGVGYRFVGCK